MHILLLFQIVGRFDISKFTIFNAYRQIITTTTLYLQKTPHNLQRRECTKLNWVTMGSHDLACCLIKFSHDLFSNKILNHK
jgi:hypothetical protein